jgi:uncharacterized OB-fold protein
MREPVKSFSYPLRIDYKILAGRALSRYLLALAEGRFVAQRCGQCGKVFLPPSGACSICALPTELDVELSGKGTVETFTVVHIPVRGQHVELPFVAAQVLLDGADTSFLFLLQECAPTSVRIGMRVEAVWADPAERVPSLASVRYFRPLKEPDLA